MMVDGARKASNFIPEDAISSLPHEVLTNILDCLPIQDVIGTSILSKNWRYKWTMLTKLIFDEDFFRYLQEKGKEEHYGRIISRLLLNLKGAITKFALFIPDGDIVDDEDIRHWVLFLSGKLIKEFTLVYECETDHKLPTHLFSCLELQHLELGNCLFHSLPSVHGFPNLLSLDLVCMIFENYNWGEFVTRCPSLKILTIYDEEPRGTVKLEEIAKIENLKMLDLSLCVLDNMMIIKPSSIFQHMCLLPKLEELSLDFSGCKFMAESDAKKRVMIAFPSLKTLTLLQIDSYTVNSCAFGVIFGSPKLQTLTINLPDEPPPAKKISEEDYNTMGQLQLQSVLFPGFRGSNNEVYLIKALLSCSPLLKKITVRPIDSLNSNKKLMFAAKLLKLHRASPTAEINFRY